MLEREVAVGSARGRVLAVLGLVVLLAGAGLLAYDRFLTGAPEPAGAERLALGRALYDAHCAACHGTDLEGEANWRQRKPDGLLPAPPHDETGHTWHHPDQQLFFMTKFGTAALVGADYETAMTGFGDRLDNKEIRAVLAYIKSRWPEQIRDRQAEITARASRAE